MGEPRLMQSGRAQEGSALLRSLRGVLVQHRLGLRSALCITANLPVRLPERVNNGGRDDVRTRSGYPSRTEVLADRGLGRSVPIPDLAIDARAMGHSRLPAWARLMCQSCPRFFGWQRIHGKTEPKLRALQVVATPTSLTSGRRAQQEHQQQHDDHREPQH
jgi:hypothetical protein